MIPIVERSTKKLGRAKCIRGRIGEVPPEIKEVAHRNEVRTGNTFQQGIAFGLRLGTKKVVLISLPEIEHCSLSRKFVRTQANDSLPGANERCQPPICLLAMTGSESFCRTDEQVKQNLTWSDPSSCTRVELATTRSLV